MVPHGALSPGIGLLCLKDCRYETGGLPSSLRDRRPARGGCGSEVDVKGAPQAPQAIALPKVAMIATWGESRATTASLPYLRPCSVVPAA